MFAHVNNSIFISCKFWQYVFHLAWLLTFWISGLHSQINIICIYTYALKCSHPLSTKITTEGVWTLSSVSVWFLDILISLCMIYWKCKAVLDKSCFRSPFHHYQGFSIDTVLLHKWVIWSLDWSFDVFSGLDGPSSKKDILHYNYSLCRILFSLTWIGMCRVNGICGNFILRKNWTLMKFFYCNNPSKAFLHHRYCFSIRPKKKLH